MAVRQGFSSRPSVKAVRQGVRVPSTDIFASNKHLHACHGLESQVVMTKATPAPGVVEEPGVFKMQYSQK